MPDEHEKDMTKLIKRMQRNAKRSGMSFDHQMENYEIMHRVWKDRIALCAALFLCSEAKRPPPMWLADAWREAGEEIMRKRTIN